VLEVLQESRLASRKLRELNANFAVVHLENTDTDVDIIMSSILKIVGDSQGVLDLVLVFLGLDVEVLVLKIVDKRLLDHVRVVSREEFGIVIEYALVLVEILLWLVQLILDVELSLLGLAEQLLGHVSLEHVCLSEVHPLQFFLSLFLSLLLESILDLSLPLGKAVENDRLIKHLLLHPWMRLDLLERWSVRWLQLPHAVEQVLQL